MSSDSFKAALAQFASAQSGEAERLDQYQVEPAKKIVEEVTEEEHRRIVNERREDFVVGDSKLGYDDAGKELWEDPAALRERRAAIAAGGNKGGKVTEKADGCPKDVGKPSALHQSFQVGSRATGASSTVASSSDKRMMGDLDSMLEEMCAGIDAGSIATAPTPSRDVQPMTTPGMKRKGEETTVTEKKVKTAGVGKTGMATVAQSVKMEVKEEIKVKSEPGEQPDGVVQLEQAGGIEEVKEELQTAKRAKTEVKDEQMSVKIEVKAEPVDVKKEAVDEAADAGEQMQAWLQSGTATDESANQEATSAQTARSGAAQPRVVLEQDGGLWFFFVDAFEDDRANPPRLYLFGKVRTARAAGEGGGQYESCCLVFDRMDRPVHLLLNVEDPDNEEEVKVAAEKARAEFEKTCASQCPGVKVLRTKQVNRNYAFEKQTKYGNGELPFLKVVCDSTGRMPLIGMFGDTFTHLFGAQTTLTERFLVKNRVMGPSWLRLRPKSWAEDNAKLSTCAMEFRITESSLCVAKKDDEKRQLTSMGMPTSSPPLRMLSVAMQTVQFSAQRPHEPVAIACTMHPRLNADAPDSDKDLRDGMRQWAAVRRLDRPLPRGAEAILDQNHVEHFSSEVALLTAMLKKFEEFDPDVITGHNAYGFDLDVLSSRMFSLKLQGWQKMGRLRRLRDKVPHAEAGRGGFFVGNNITAGRLVCDVMLQAKDLLPKVGNYDLPTLAREHLGVQNLQVVEPENLQKFYETGDALKSLAEVTFYNALSIARLSHSLQILPLTKQLTNLAGNMWNMSLQNQRAQRNEMLLCHEFHKRKFVLPDKEPAWMKKKAAQQLADEGGDGQEQGPSGKRGKAAYSGGLVLEPKVGLYDDFVIMLDFNSLYPSIIQEHNICFTTVERPNEVQLAQCGTEAELLSRTRQPDGTLDEGVLPQVLRRLVESRRSVKGAMKSERDPRRKQMLEIRQLALKLTANSMYGCLGFQHSRFYAKPLACLVTAKGRDALQTTINVVQQELMLDVVYGDTDSVFVNMKTQDYHQAMQTATQIKHSVNKRYKKLEIEIDAVFGRLMLLKKKKYAALKIVDYEKQVWEREIKGLDIVRRDWCKWAKNMGEQVLMKVLSNEGKEEAVQWIHSFLQEKAQVMDEGKVDLKEYVITKGLTRDPKDYPDAKNQPHVQVAMRQIARGKAIRSGQEVGYIICEPPKAVEGDEAAPAKLSISDRARHITDFEVDDTLKVDIAWYKKAQVHPLVSRLLGPVEGTDSARIAECIGLDGSRFAQAEAAAGNRAGDDEDGFAAAVGDDVNALFDRKARFKTFECRLPGVKCKKCGEVSAWKQMLLPDDEAKGWNALLQCSKCPEQVHPKVAHNMLVLQMRDLLKEHCEGWVKCPGDETIERTRRVPFGANILGPAAVLRELEYLEFLCEAEHSGSDPRSCQPAIAKMRRSVQHLLEMNGFNWVDCGQVFGGIFATAAK